MKNFVDLQTAVARGATRDEAGTTYTAAIKSVIIRALKRISKEAKWRSMRRKTFFATKTAYTEGTGAGAFTKDAITITVTGATFLTDSIEIGRRITLSGSNKKFIIRKITGETAITLDQVYDGTTTTTGTYSILGQEEYNLPIQSSHRMFLWHEEYGYPFTMRFTLDQDFYSSGVNNTQTNIPTHYRMWGENMVKEQLRDTSNLTVSSTAIGDVSKNITVFGTVSGYPGFETLTTHWSDATSGVAGSISFESVERLVKNDTSSGRMDITANSGNTTVAVIPSGDITDGILYKKIQIYPLPTTAFNINIYYYKDPYNLVHDSDVHDLGGDFDQAIIFLATSLLYYEDNESDKGDKFIALYKDELRNLRKTNIDKPDWYPRLLRARENSIFGGRVQRYLSYNQVGGDYGPRGW